jgi:hypothetical protein
MIADVITKRNVNMKVGIEENDFIALSSDSFVEAAAMRRCCELQRDHEVANDIAKQADEDRARKIQKAKGLKTNEEPVPAPTAEEDAKFITEGKSEVAESLSKRNDHQPLSFNTNEGENEGKKEDELNLEEEEGETKKNNKHASTKRSLDAYKKVTIKE